MFDITLSMFYYIYHTVSEQNCTKSICVIASILSVLPFTFCYDIGYIIGTKYYAHSVATDVTPQIAQSAPIVPLRRSARLAEKRLKIH